LVALVNCRSAVERSQVASQAGSVLHDRDDEFLAAACSSTSLGLEKIHLCLCK
jgi:hypothetical protein